jgi:hypothetical protein
MNVQPQGLFLCRCAGDIGEVLASGWKSRAAFSSRRASASAFLGCRRHRPCGFDRRLGCLPRPIGYHPKALQSSRLAGWAAHVSSCHHTQVELWTAFGGPVLGPATPLVDGQLRKPRRAQQLSRKKNAPRQGRVFSFSTGYMQWMPSGNWPFLHGPILATPCG